MFIEKIYLRQNITNLFRFTGSVFLVFLLCSFITHIPEGVIFSAVCLYFSVAAYFAFRYDPFYFHSKRPALCFSQRPNKINVLTSVINNSAGPAPKILVKPAMANIKPIIMIHHGKSLVFIS